MIQASGNLEIGVIKKRRDFPIKKFVYVYISHSSFYEMIQSVSWEESPGHEHIRT